MDEAGLVGDDDELGAVAGVEFGHGVVNVRAYGQGAEVQPRGDVRVGESVGGQGHDFAFAVGEVGQVLLGCGVGAGLGGGEEAGDEVAGGLGREEGVAGGDGADAGDETLGADVLAQEAAGSGVKGPGDVFLGLEGGEDENAGARGRGRRRSSRWR